MSRLSAKMESAAPVIEPLPCGGRQVRGPSAGVRDLEAAEAFADLDIQFVGAGGFGFCQAAAGDFDEDAGALVFRGQGESRRRGA